MVRKQHNAKVKAEVAYTAIKGEQTIAEISQQYGVHPSQIHAWKAEVIKGMEGLFNQSKSNTDKLTQSLQHISTLEKKIGQLVMENDFLKKSFKTILPTKGGS